MLDILNFVKYSKSESPEVMYAVAILVDTLQTHVCQDNIHSSLHADSCCSAIETIDNYWNGLRVAVLEELVASGRLAGSLMGGRHDKAMYVPDVYIKAQNDWVDNFYKQNGYLGKYISVFSTQESTNSFLSQYIYFFYYYE